MKTSSRANRWRDAFLVAVFIVRLLRVMVVLKKQILRQVGFDAAGGIVLLE